MRVGALRFVGAGLSAGAVAGLPVPVPAADACERSHAAGVWLEYRPAACPARHRNPNRQCQHRRSRELHVCAAVDLVFRAAKGISQAIGLLVVWIHGCIGLHFWLRLKPLYPRIQFYLFAAAVLVPVLALFGFVEAGREVARLVASPDWPHQTMAALHVPDGARVDRLAAILHGVDWAFAAALVLTLVAREGVILDRAKARTGANQRSGRHRRGDRARIGGSRGEPPPRRPARLRLWGTRSLLDLPRPDP